MPSNPLTPLQKARKRLENTLEQYGLARGDGDSYRIRIYWNRAQRDIDDLIAEAQAAVHKVEAPK